VAAIVRRERPAEASRKLEDEFPNPWHPVVRVHPGDRPPRALRQSPVLHAHQGPEESTESDALLSSSIARPPSRVQSGLESGQPNTLVMWDNRRPALRPCATTYRRGRLPWSA
jgi:hypothetical protein